MARSFTGFAGSDEQPIPPAAMRNPDPVGTPRVWIAEREPHRPLRTGSFGDAMRLWEERARRP